MKTSLRLACALLALAASRALAQSPVDNSSPLETITTEFAMCDGPAWDGSSLWVPDVKGGKLYRYWPKPKKLQVALANAGRISAVDFNLGQLYLSDNGEGSISAFKDGGKVTIAKCESDTKPPARPNDLVVDSHGGVYYTLTAAGCVVYLAPDGKQSVAAADIDTPNGLALAPDEQTLYVDSYVPKKLWAFPLARPGAAGERRLLASMDSGPDKGADGMTIDRAGNIYCTGPAHVWVWSPGGKLLTKIETPSRPINCVFGDGDMHALYITGLEGLYRQQMHLTGVPPEPSLKSAEQPKPDARVLSTALPEGVEAHLNVVYAQYGDRKMLADIFVPKKSRQSPLPAVVVVHGGGWVNGDKARFRAMALGLAARGYVTAAIEYRLAGEAKFPAAYWDCNAAVQFLRAKAESYGIDPRRVGAVGGSAGGHLVGLMAAGKSAEEAIAAFMPDAIQQGDHPQESSRVQAAVVLAGPMELATGPVAERSHKRADRSFTIQFLGQTIDEAPRLYDVASPYSHFTKDTAPILFLTGELDNPARDDNAVKRLKELGVWSEQKIYAGGKHGCWMQHPWFEQMLGDIDTFFQAKLL